MRIGTLCLLVDGDRVLLAMKKRGFGVGKWNGVGGKVHAEETIETAALRELGEEIGVSAEPEHLEKAGFLFFRSAHDPDLNWNMHIFIVRNWRGEPSESEEVRPAWFHRSQIPFDAMWPDDKHWFPYILESTPGNPARFTGTFKFNKDGTDFDSFELKES